MCKNENVNKFFFERLQNLNDSAKFLTDIYQKLATFFSFNTLDSLNFFPAQKIVQLSKSKVIWRKSLKKSIKTRDQFIKNGLVILPKLSTTPI